VIRILEEAMGFRKPLLCLLAAGLLVAFTVRVQAEPGEHVPGRCILMFKTPVALKLDAVLEGGGKLAGACGDGSLDRIFSRFGVTQMKRLFPDVDQVIRKRGRLSVREAYDAYQAKIRAKFPDRSARAPAGLKHIDTFGIYVLSFNPRTSVHKICQGLLGTGHVVWAEPDGIRKGTYTPSSNARWTSLWGIQKIDCETAWDSARGQGVTVAVIDTGVDLGHADLAAQCVAGYDFVNNDSNPQDDQGHGTHCAGTVAAIDNTIGVVGVAFNAQIMPLKGLASSGGGTDTWLINCMNWAVANGADVMSCSWGGFGHSNNYETACANAVAAGVVPVFAAGNDDMDGANHGPSNCMYAFAVSASTQTDGRADFSNYGIKSDVTAPGVAILSCRLGGGYVNAQGTRSSAPAQTIRKGRDGTSGRPMDASTWPT
jgi:thermitase